MGAWSIFSQLPGKEVPAVVAGVTKDNSGSTPILFIIAVCVDKLGIGTRCLKCLFMV